LEHENETGGHYRNVVCGGSKALPVRTYLLVVSKAAQWLENFGAAVLMFQDIV
jgi:hypothetical protein